MLYASLVCSGIILVAGILATRYANHPVDTTLGWAAVVTILPIVAIIVFPAVWLQTAILCGGLLIAGLFGSVARAIIPVSLLAVLIAYGVVATSISRDEQVLDKLRAQYAFESIEDRLPRRIPGSTLGDLDSLVRLEELVDREEGGRRLQLERLHHVTVDRFVSSAGFGLGRMIAHPRNNGEPRESTPEQPDYFLLAPKELEGTPRPGKDSLLQLNQEGFLDFVNPNGFGYFKDRRHVAGFQSHGFSKVPEDPDLKWRVARLELVGLLQHDMPVVYLSNKLPRMDELKDAPTRPLDDFETTALKSLSNGAELHTSDAPGEVRFLGAIRSTKQCVACHGGTRGALLGAFTYRLTPGAR